MSQEFQSVSLPTELDALFAGYTASDQAPGLVYGIVSREGLQHSRGFGAAILGGPAPDASTLFPIASMSKSFMACAALVARDRGLLSLDDPVTRWVPEFTVSPSGARVESPPTIGMLLSMCGGLTEDNAWVDPFIDMPTDELLAIIGRGVRFSRPPGSAFEYSNIGYTIGCLAVARAAGRTVGEWVREAVLDPLGLDSTFVDHAVPDDRARAIGYSLDLAGEWTPFAPVASDGFAGAGGLMSSVANLARWITWLGSAFREDESGEPDPVLSATSRREMQRIHVSDTPALVAGGAGGLGLGLRGYALGLVVDTDLHRGDFVWHSGGLPGFLLAMRWHPDSGHGMVVLTNSHRGNPVALGQQALARVLEREQAAATTVTLWPETTALQEEAEALVRDWDHERATRILADNVAFDRPLEERRAEIARLIDEVGPLRERAPGAGIVSAVTAADVTWSIPGERGELLCMIHLTPVDPPQIQEFVVVACDAQTPRAVRPADISPRRAGLGDAFLSPALNTRVHAPRER